ncbi:MAG: hypothetical protein EOP56_08105 [Sphingobacteriales bacterium]|nr:MAG: hypothetical protein EOP56_08105 [Sphingobacteriales bacterium]
MSLLNTLQDHYLQVVDTNKPESSMKLYIDILTRVFPRAVIEEKRNGHLITYELHTEKELTEEELRNKHRSLKAQLGPRLISTECEGSKIMVYTRGIPAVSALS